MVSKTENAIDGSYTSALGNKTPLLQWEKYSDQLLLDKHYCAIIYLKGTRISAS